MIGPQFEVGVSKNRLRNKIQQYTVYPIPKNAQRLKNYLITNKKTIKVFWNLFPKNINKDKVSSKVNLAKLEILINQCAKKWTFKEKNIAEKCLFYLFI
jgi:hypothetical protein